MNPKRLRWLLWVLVPALAFALMWFWFRKPVPEVDSTTAEVLEAAVEKWWQRGEPSRTIPEAEWPPELRRLDPKTVRAGPAGVFIEFGSFYVEEWGLFVMPKGSDFQPKQGTDPSFEFLRGRVYRYDIVG